MNKKKKVIDWGFTSEQIWKSEKNEFCPCHACLNRRKVYSWKGFFVALFWFLLFAGLVGLIGATDFNSLTIK